jgi:hypothetical protein
MKILKKVIVHKCEVGGDHPEHFKGEAFEVGYEIMESSERVDYILVYMGHGAPFRNSWGESCGVRFENVKGTIV